MTQVNAKVAAQDVTPAALRAYMARHGVKRTAIARRYGCSPNFVSAAIWSDLNGKPISMDVLRRIREIAKQINFEREL